MLSLLTLYEVKFLKMLFILSYEKRTLTNFGLLNCIKSVLKILQAFLSLAIQLNSVLIEFWTLYLLYFAYILVNEKIR